MSVDQDREMGTILLRLELVSHAATLNYNPSGGQSGEPDDRMVAIVLRGEEYPHLTFRRRYRGCNTDADREAVLAAARAELEVWKPRDWQKLKDAPSITTEQIIIADGEGWDPDALAQAHRMTPTQIRKIRSEANLDTETGKALTTTALDRAEKVAKAHELNAKGLSLRQIGMHIGVGAETVRRYLQSPTEASVD